LNIPSLRKFESRVLPGGVLIYNSSLIADEPQRKDIIKVPVKANELAEQAGSYKAANMVAIGALLKARTQIASLQTVKDALAEAVSKRNIAFNDINKKALTLGFESVKVPIN